MVGEFFHVLANVCEGLLLLVELLGVVVIDNLLLLVWVGVIDAGVAWEWSVLDVIL